MSNDGITIFKSNSSGSASVSDFLVDGFQDFTVAGTSNVGLTDNANTNPLSYKFGDTDDTRFGIKTLYIRDIKIFDDRTKWINGMPTYEIIWSENFPAIKGYVAGNFSFSQIKGQQGDTVPKSLIFGKENMIFGVEAVATRVAFQCLGNNMGYAADQMLVDNANTLTTTYGSINSQALNIIYDKFLLQVTSSSDQTRDLHDFRVTQIPGAFQTVRVFGVSVDMSTASIWQEKGSTYVGRTKVTSSVGTTFAVPALGSSLGGNVLVYKTSGGYTLSAISATTMKNICIGFSGTNLLLAPSGTGASFQPGYALVASQGSSSWLGVVQSISTDTLTVFPTLPFGVSTTVYRNWISNATYAINASLYTLVDTIDFNKTKNTTLGNIAQSAIGEMFMLDRGNKWFMWGEQWHATNLMLDTINYPGASGIADAVLDDNAGLALNQNEHDYLNSQWPVVLMPQNTAPKLYLEGRFEAVSIEFVNHYRNGATCFLSVSTAVNGIPGYSIQNPTAGYQRYTMFADSGVQWNQLALSVGLSAIAASGLVNFGISKIELFKRNVEQGSSIGRLAQIPVQAAFAEQKPHNATFISNGVFERVPAARLPLVGEWVLTTADTSNLATGFIAVGSSTNSKLTMQYYGGNFALVGHTFSTSSTLLIDGVQRAATLNIMHSVAIGWHEVIYQSASFTTMISGFDYCRNYQEEIDLRKFTPNSSAISKKVQLPYLTDWKQYHVNIGTQGVTAPTFQSTVKYCYGQWRRVGDEMEIKFALAQSGGSGSAGSGTYTFSLPQGYQIDTSKQASDASNSAAPNFGAAGLMAGYGLIDAGSTFSPIYIYAYEPRRLSAASSIYGDVSSSTVSFNTNPFVMTFHARVPIQGWRSSQEIEVING